MYKSNTRLTRKKRKVSFIFAFIKELSSFCFLHFSLQTLNKFLYMDCRVDDFFLLCCGLLIRSFSFPTGSSRLHSDQLNSVCVCVCVLVAGKKENMQTQTHTHTEICRHTYSFMKTMNIH